jgi:N-acetylglucosaminyldiphosphoundecaprenol N-acetyl-beta-D-mannosaminyltransferase
MFILGVKVDAVTKNEAIAKIAGFLDEEKSHVITTPNPEIILYARKHQAYREILNKSDLALPDGEGLLIVSRFMKEKLTERVSGADMVPAIAVLAREKKLKIGLLGGLDQATVDKAAMVMRGWGNEVVFASHGVTKKDWQNSAFHEKIIRALRSSAPQVVYVAFGHPKQEEWIDKYKTALPSVRLFIGCGGSLEFVAGVAQRAPSWMQRAGLEWLWRLAIEPKRIKRIFNAVIIFPLTVLYVSIRKK